MLVCLYFWPVPVAARSKAKVRQLACCYCGFESHRGMDVCCVCCQHLTDKNTRNVFWGQRRPVRRADNPTIKVPTVLKSGSLNLLLPPEPVQVGKVNAFSLTHSVWLSDTHCFICYCITLIIHNSCITFTQMFSSNVSYSRYVDRIRRTAV
jgi:hypothetical protein